MKSLNIFFSVMLFSIIVNLNQAAANEVCEAIWPEEQTPNFTVPGSTQQPAIPVPSGNAVRNNLPSDQGGIRTFQTGDYVIQASEINGQLPFARYQTSGTTTRLFVVGDLNLRYQQQGNQSLLLNFNSYDENDFQPPANFVLVVIGNLSIDRRVSISGYVYATGNVTFEGQSGQGNRVLVSGAITSSSEIINLNDAVVNENYITPPPELDTGGFCEAVITSPSRILAIDDFEDYTAGSIIGSNGGTGAWQGPWQGDPNSQQVIDTSNDPLVYEAPNGEVIRGGARALQLTSNNDRAAFRELDQQYNDDVVYVSMLVRFDVDRSNQNRFAALWFEQSGFSDVPNLGLKTREGNGGINANDIFVRTTRSNDRYSTVVERNRPYFIVARFEKSSGANYDRMQLWVDPETLSQKPNFDSEASGASGISSFSEVGYRLVNLAGGESATVDRLAIGTSWQDVVTPQLAKHAFYPFDLCYTDAPVIDLAKGNTGSPNDVQRAVDGKVGAAGRFNGSSSYVDIPAQVLNSLTDFTISVWVKPEPSNDYRTIISGSNNDSANNQSLSQFEVYLTDNSQVRIGYKGDYLRFGANEPQVPSDTWSHILVRKRESEICLFINGDLRNCQTVNESSALRVEQAAIGAWRQRQNSRSDHFLGLIDELIVYRSAISNSRVTQLFSRQQDSRNPDGSIREDVCENQCFVDDFGDGLSQSWVTSRSSGSFTPAIVAGNNQIPPRLRLTEDVGNQSTAITLQRIFPSDNNRLVIEFDYYGWSSRTGTGADGVAVILSDASVSARPGSFGGSLGYAQRDNGDPGFAGGWIGVGLDEFGNYSRNNEGRVEGPGFKRNAVAIRGSEAASYRYLAGTEGGLNPPIDVRNTNQPGPGHRYRVMVDTTGGETIISVDRDTGLGFQSLIPPFNAEGFTDQGPPPAEMLLSFTGSTGGSSNNHEIGNISVCADEWYPVGSQVERFRIRHAPSAINCLASEFEVTACADTSCSTIFTEQPVSITMADTQGNFIGGNNFSLSNGQGRFFIQNPQPDGVSRLQVLSSTPVARPLSSDLCETLDGQSSVCDIRFNRSGLIISSSADLLQNQHENQIAGVNFDSYIHVVDTVEETLACQPRLVDQPIDVDLELNCIDPAACGDIQEYFEVNGNTFTRNGTSYQGSVPLTFIGSTANLQNIYSDVGKVNFSARLSLPEDTTPGSEGPDIELESTVDFIVAPYRLELLAFDRDGRSNPATLAGGEPFVRAGEAFEIQIASYNALNQRTSNFGRESMTQATTQFSSLVFPAEGRGSSSLFNPGDFQQHVTGTLRSLDASWDEAGSVEVAPAYLVESFYYPWAPTLLPKLTVGRFYPDSIRKVSGSDLILFHQCVKNFSYMDNRDIEIEYTLEAINTGGDRTENYGRLITGGGAHYSDNVSIGVAADTLPSSRIIQDVYDDWVEGLLSVSLDTELAGMVGISRDDIPDGPVTPELGLIISSLANNEGTTFSITNFDSFEGPSGLPLGSIDARYGRVQLSDIFGPEDEDLPILIRAEYWDDSSGRFILNRDDSCSMFQLADFQSESPSIDSEPVNRGRLMLQDGQADELQGPSWSAPGGLTEFRFCVQVPNWLTWDHSEEIDVCRAGAPTATATFGQYRGNDRIIFWLERGL